MRPTDHPDHAAPSVETLLTAALDALGNVPDDRAAAFSRRLRAAWPELIAAYDAVYGTHPERDAQLAAIVTACAAHAAARSPELAALDEVREADPGWFQSPSMIGYVCYTERFSGTLHGLLDRIGYLEELGVRYVHLMPLLRPREGDNDGGYAVRDYGAVRPDLGSMDDLEAVARRLRERGMSTCIDLVINHTAAEHEWARLAVAGDPVHERFYRIYPDRTEPDEWERSLPEVFPDFAPGNFTQLPDGRWVWTTFNSWQWDLDWSNPAVFAAVLGILLDLAARGIDVFRLDAVAFMWKRKGTSCQNQPEVHWILRALRACARAAAPAVIFKAEAIVAPDDLAPYLGVAAPGVPAGRECDLAYHNSLMVQYWSSVAARDTRLMRHVLGAFPHKPSTAAWGTYIRCHDDIGWAITEADAAAVGWDGYAHRRFLADFYAGDFAGSFARGVDFQHNPVTGDKRTSGAFASLAGLEAALEAHDPIATDLAIARILAGYALILGWDGIPLLYMGDELGLRNDWSFRGEPAHAADNRWVHRPHMDWSAAERRHDAGSVEGRLFGGVRRLIAIRTGLRQLHVAAPLAVADAGDPALFAYLRGEPGDRLLAVHSFADRASVAAGGTLLAAAGIAEGVDLLTGEPVTADGHLAFAPYQVRWIVAPGSAAPGSAGGRAAAAPGPVAAAP